MARERELQDLQACMVSAGTLGAVLRLSERRVQQLAPSGVVKRVGRGQYDLVASVQGYVGWLQDELVRDVLRELR